MKPECENCYFFERTSKESGHCHRYPPQICDTVSVFPTVGSDSWCGEFRTDFESR